MNFSLLTTASETTTSTFSALLLPLAMLAILYFLMIRPQQKKAKADSQMRSAIEVGDDIVTIGGIIGTVVSIKDETMVIETGSDRSKIRINRWAVQSNITPKETPAETKK